MDRTEIKNRLKITLDKKYGNIQDYKYNCFYRALDSGYGDDKRLWQQTVIEYMIEDSGSLAEFFKRVEQSTKDNKSLPLRTCLPLTNRDSYEVHKSKPFPFGKAKKEIDLEHAIKFNLLGKELEPFGKFISYEVAVANDEHSGAIDCIAYNAERNELRLIEIKRYRVRGHKENEENFLRAYSEIFTYRAFFENYDKDFLSREFEKTGNKINFNNVKIINCIFGPRSMFECVDGKLIEYIDNAEGKYGVELYEIYPAIAIEENTLIGCEKVLTNIRPTTLTI